MSTALPELPIRRLTRGDLADCADLSEDRGWSREENTWGLLLAAGTAFGIDDPEGKGLAACCVLTPYGSDLAAVGKLLVARRYGHQGIGRRLMGRVLEAAGGTPLVLYATPYGQPLYQKLGFTDIGHVERLRGRLSADAADSVADVSTRRATAEDIPSIVKLDAECFGLDRTSMITRLPAMTERLWVAEDSHGLSGFTAVWDGSEQHKIGPLTAKDSRTARALLVAASGAAEGPVRTDIDGRHRSLLDWAVGHGMEPVGSTVLMTYGIDGLPGDWRRSFAPLSVATG
ncbi:GNAT family N-acetyltransferase [Streptomyces qinzhouensis]|uniref:GNAT family N-acetyltransferase n=1 Tax=Streptomyces qinzhouensis TaxID=2599401 RepID=A0A5B8J8W7_9ACTN|nr:GNAT family N-acetyltransferase [Streptomyces qinzhouensis]QDY77797.1 GNAT family N-acetyltransferase [Streptomyces qinzhouensis]